MVRGTPGEKEFRALTHKEFSTKTSHEILARNVLFRQTKHVKLINNRFSNAGCHPVA